MFNFSFKAFIMHLQAAGTLPVETKEVSSPTMMMEHTEMIAKRVSIEALVKLGLPHPPVAGA
jgi:hypothetical protein